MTNRKTIAFTLLILCMSLILFSGCSSKAPEETAAAAVTFTVRYTDENGDPVSGVMCQVCDDSTCQMFVSDEMGICAISLTGTGYELHTLKIPEGYTGDTQTAVPIPAQGGALTITLEKAE